MSDFENFVNLELPKRIATNENPVKVKAGFVPLTTGIGLLTELVPHNTGGLAVDLITDLTDPDQWTSASGKVFIEKGARVSVVEEADDLKGVWWLKENDFTDINNWEMLGGGNGSLVRREYFTNETIVTIQDVMNFPLVNVFIEDDVGRPSLFGEYMFGEFIYTQEFELGYATPTYRTTYNPIKHELTITLLDTSSGVVVITE